MVAAYVYLTRVQVDFGGSGFFLPGPGAEGAIDLGPDGGRRIGALTAADERQLRLQREQVEELARRHVGTPISGGSRDDLRVLQALLDQKVLRPDQTWELQALGVALGDVMVEQLGFRWVIVEDDLGRSRALRLGDSDALVFPVTMISKRIEKDVRFSVSELYEKVRTIAARGGTLPDS